MNNVSKVNRHNYLLNKLKEKEEINEKNLSSEKKEKLLLEKAEIVTKIDSIRKELGIYTSTVINIEDIK